MNVILWYTGLFLLTCFLGMKKLPDKARNNILIMFIPIMIIEPIIAQTFHISILPPTFFLSFIVNSIEISGFCFGCLIGDKLRLREKKNESNKMY